MKYFTWPLSVSGDALRHLDYAIALYRNMRGDSMAQQTEVELANIQNEARAMVQQIANGDRRPHQAADDIDPLLR